MSVVEIYFEKFVAKQLVELVCRIRQACDKFWFNSSLELDSETPLDEILSIRKKNGAYVQFQFRDVCVFGVKFEWLSVHVSLDNLFDDEVIFLFDESEFDKLGEMAVRAMAENVARFLQAQKCYCGLEPAFDELTQFFKFEI